MRIAFYSNFLNHHQLPFCLAMNELTAGNFVFVATHPISVDRLKLGYRDLDSEYPFVLRAYNSMDDKKKAELLAIESDIAIFGHCPETYVTIRMKENKLSFRYTERMYKDGLWKVLSPRGLFWMIHNHTRYANKRFYMLCASAFAAFDYGLVGAYWHKALKWGYFPEVKVVDADELIKDKRKNEHIRLLWVGRFIEIKHPEAAIELARKLRDDGKCFELVMIGCGNEEDKINKMIADYHLQEYVSMLGAMPPENVRKEMEQSDVFLFTSDFREGWGAVLNEAMNSACAVVASSAIGSVPYLIKDGKNGFIYKNGDIDDLFMKVTRLINNVSLRESIEVQAYNTLSQLWNGRVAAERLIFLSESILNGNGIDLFEDGPCSPAPIMHNGWYKNR